MEYFTTNYQVPKTVERITDAVGNIDRLSIAVLVDGVRETQTDADGNTTQAYQPRTEEELTKLSDVVKNAVGFDASRNDQFQIENIPFDGNEIIEPQSNSPFPTDLDYWMSVGQRFLPFVFIGIFLLILRSRFKKMKVSMAPKALHVGAGGASAILPPEENVPLPRIEEGVTPEAQESAKLLKQISQFVEEKPSMAVKLIRYWLLEE
jgi:flagellar M-ring protein FliF